MMLKKGCNPYFGSDIQKDWMQLGKIKDLKVEQIGGTAVRLSWTLPCNKQCPGADIIYDVRWANNKISEKTWPDANEIFRAYLLKEEGDIQTIIVDNLIPGARYWYAIKFSDGTRWSELSVSVANKPQSLEQVDVWQMCGDSINARNRRLMQAVQPDFIGRTAFEYAGTVMMDRGYEACPSLEALKNTGALLGSGFTFLHYGYNEPLGPDVNGSLLGSSTDTMELFPPGEMMLFDWSTDNPDKQMIYKGKKYIDLGFDAVELDLSPMNDSHAQNVYNQLKEYAAIQGKSIYITGNFDNIPGESAWDDVQRFTYADFALRQYPRNWITVENQIDYYRKNVVRDGSSKLSVAFVDCGPSGLVIPEDKERWPLFYRFNEAQLMAAGILPGCTYLYGDSIGFENYVIQMNNSKFIRENRELFHGLSCIQPATLVSSAPKVFISALGQEGRILLHLVNGNEDVESNKTIAQENFLVHVSLEGMPEAIWMTTPDKLSHERKENLTFIYNSNVFGNGIAAITVPRLEYHNVVIIEQGAPYNPVYSPMEILFPFPVRDTIPVNNKTKINCLQTEGHSSTFDWFVNDIRGGNEIYGIMDSNGCYTAPASVPEEGKLEIKAVSKESPDISGKVYINVVPSPELPWKENFGQDEVGSIPANWEIVDGRGDWEVSLDGSEKVLHAANMGDYMEYGMITGGDQSWSNYEFSCKVRILKTPYTWYNFPSQYLNTYIGFVFGYEDQNNYYTYKIRYDNKSALYRVRNGSPEQIGEPMDCSFPTVGVDVGIKVVLKKGTSCLQVDNHPVREDYGVASSGGIGFLTVCTKAYFQNISVSSNSIR